VNARTNKLTSREAKQRRIQFARLCALDVISFICCDDAVCSARLCEARCGLLPNYCDQWTLVKRNGQSNLTKDLTKTFDERFKAFTIHTVMRREGTLALRQKIIIGLMKISSHLFGAWVLTRTTYRSPRSHYVVISSPVRAKRNCNRVLTRWQQIPSAFLPVLIFPFNASSCVSCDYHRDQHFNIIAALW